VVCVPELSGGGVGGDWDVLSKYKCGFLSYACALGWVIHVFHDEGGELGWNWYSLLIYTSVEFCVVCSLSMKVFAVLGSQEGCAYERMGLMYCLYT